MPSPSSPGIRKAVKQVTAMANRKFGKDWSLLISNDSGLQIEARHMDGKIVQSIVWIGGRIESRTTVAKGS
jgi:hypothetical protein